MDACFKPLLKNRVDPSSKFSHSYSHVFIHSFILPTAVKIFYTGSYFCYHNCNSVRTIKVDDGGCMVGRGCK